MKKIPELAKLIEEHKNKELTWDSADETITNMLETLEVLLERAGQYDRLENELLTYVAQLNKDVDSIGNIRRGVTMLAAVFSLSILALMAVAVFGGYFENANIKEIWIAFFAGGFLAVFGVVSALVKGSFRTAQEQHSVFQLPGYINELWQAVRSDRQ